MTRTKPHLVILLLSCAALSKTVPSSPTTARHICWTDQKNRRQQRMTWSWSALWCSLSRDGQCGACFHQIFLGRIKNLRFLLFFISCSMAVMFFLIWVDMSSSKILKKSWCWKSR